MNTPKQAASMPSSIRSPITLGGPTFYGSYAVKLRISKIHETVELKGKRVLDVGCGNGCYPAELASRAASVYGIDIQLPQLKAFTQPIPRVQGAGENLPFTSETFDVVTMIEVLEHTRNDREVLQECFRVLKPGGQLVLFVPNKLYPFESHPCRLGKFSIGRNIPLISWLPEFLRKHLCDARIYARRGLFSLAHSVGFQDHTGGYIFPPLDSLSLPFKDSYRRLARRLEKSPLARFGVSIYAVFQKSPMPVSARQTARPIEGSSFEALVGVHEGVHRYAQKRDFEDIETSSRPPEPSRLCSSCFDPQVAGRKDSSGPV